MMMVSQFTNLTTFYELSSILNHCSAAYFKQLKQQHVTLFGILAVQIEILHCHILVEILRHLNWVQSVAVGVYCGIVHPVFWFSSVIKCGNALTRMQI